MQPESYIYKSTDQINVGNTFSCSSLQSRRSYNICLLVHKCISNLAPPYLLNEFNFSSDIHKCNTRKKELLRQLLARTFKFQSSFRLNAVKIWNLLPAKIRPKNFFQIQKSTQKPLQIFVISFRFFLLYCATMFEFNVVIQVPI